MACLAAVLLLGTAASPCSAEETTTKTAVSVEEACQTAASAQAGVSYDHCVSTLASEARGCAAADMQQRLAVAAADHATATGARMEGLGEAEESARARARLRHCLDLYGGAADLLRARVYGRASQQLAAALGAPESCEDAWKGEDRAPVAAHDREYGRLALLALGLTTAIVA
ncbi:hypothetical protein HU200_056521 [Digitaria exilis]|uniref:Pectinesterase inhibitor domain-containing protein n=1 Tax=Digitaria exilis TaxID=1010633 RepID=A0A835AFS2_9POAL|nr:hypothetical protein HU200_056521 [Digitaria exilis]CAB3466711.1 unnamed protein product [Digitaria exilis]